LSVPVGPPPTPTVDRLSQIDFLRGIALLAILVMNIQSFAMPMSAMSDPLNFGVRSPLDYFFYLAGHLFIYTKALAVFSILFGVGILLQTERVESSGRSAAGVFYRRMGFLAVAGLLHAYLLWYGDILFMYAVIGSLAFLLRKLSWRWLIGIGSVLQLLTILFYGLLTALMLAVPSIAAEVVQPASPDMPEVLAEIAAYRGSYLHDQLPQRAYEAIIMQVGVLPFMALPVNGGLMLIGMGLWKRGFFASDVRSRTLALVSAVMIAIGFAVAGFDAYLILTLTGADADHYTASGSILLVLFSSPFLAIGYLALFTLVYRALPGAITQPLVSAGRMALSGYLLTTLICTTIYYGHGFGYFMHHSRSEQFLVVLGVWAFLLVFSTIWLRAFRFGPFEWLWRSATYRTWQPMLRRSVSA
jgi:uncharacterized protein